MLAKLFDSTDRSAELHLVLLILVVLAIIVLTAYAVVVHGQAFSANDLGAGCGWALGGGGAAAAGQGLQSKLGGNDAV